MTELIVLVLVVRKGCGKVLCSEINKTKLNECMKSKKLTKKG